MTSFNVTIIQPPQYPHSLALLEVAEYLHSSLVRCGASSEVSFNRIERGAHNVVLCAHLLAEKDYAAIPPNSIIFNSEQLTNRGFWNRVGACSYGKLLDNFTIWDYSHQNLDTISHNRKALIPLLFSGELVRPGLVRRGGAFLCFYGCITDRRRRVLKEIARAGVPVKALFGAYGTERDTYFSNAWAVLNLRSADDVQTFEPVRCFYPLTNRIPVISESAPGDRTFRLYQDFLFSYDVEHLVDAVRDHWTHRQEFEALAVLRLDRFARTSATEAFRGAFHQFLNQAATPSVP